jgi:nitronate monooxygenase
MKKLNIGGLVAGVPVVQGGMGVGVSLSGLASAVARAGAIGVIAAAGIGVLRSDAIRSAAGGDVRGLRTEIRKARSATDGIIGVNVMVVLSEYSALAAAAVAEGADIIFSGAGLPLDLPSYLRPGCRTRLVPIVSSARAFRIIATRWLTRFQYAPDAVVVEGPRAGGHLGFKREQIDDPDYALEKLLPPVVEEARRIGLECGKTIPVVAAGGVYTGGDIHRFMRMGAAGVQMATRFVGTHECDAAPGFKQAYIDAREDDVVIIQSPVGMPGRAIRNQYIDDVSDGMKKPFDCPCHCIISCDVANSPYCIARALINAQKGNMEQGFAFAGANAYRVNEIVSVKELIAELEAEYDCAEASDRRAESRVAV